MQWDLKNLFVRQGAAKKTRWEYSVIAYFYLTDKLKIGNNNTQAFFSLGSLIRWTDSWKR